MNPLILFGSKARIDPHDFQDGVYKVLIDMWVSLIEKGESDSYKLREVSKVRYTQ